MLETEERQKALLLELEDLQKEEYNQEADKTEALFEAMQKQLQEHTTAELGLLHGDLGELCCDLNGQEVRLSTVKKSVSNIEQTMSEKISAVEDSIATIKEQIKSEVEQFLSLIHI